MPCQIAIKPRLTPRILCMCGLVSLVAITTANAQAFNEKGTVLITVNPLKLALGIINAEFEYFISPAASLQLSSEYVVFHYRIKRDQHPDFVMRAGPRYHALNQREYGQRNDLYFGTYAGFTWSGFDQQLTMFHTGVEGGYKYQFDNRIVINPKLLLTVPLPRPEFIPGFEVLFGVAW